MLRLLTGGRRTIHLAQESLSEVCTLQSTRCREDLTELQRLGRYASQENTTTYATCSQVTCIQWRDAVASIALAGVHETAGYIYISLIHIISSHPSAIGTRKGLRRLPTLPSSLLGLL